MGLPQPGLRERGYGRHDILVRDARGAHEHEPPADRSAIHPETGNRHDAHAARPGKPNQIRVRSKAEQTFLIQLCNGAEGYLPTVKAEKGGHYSAFISSGECGHEGGELYVRETLQEIQELFPEVE